MERKNLEKCKGIDKNISFQLFIASVLSISFAFPFYSISMSFPFSPSIPLTSMFFSFPCSFLSIPFHSFPLLSTPFHSKLEVPNSSPGRKRARLTNSPVKILKRRVMLSAPFHIRVIPFRVRFDSMYPFFVVLSMPFPFHVRFIPFRVHFDSMSIPFLYFHFLSTPFQFLSLPRPSN